MKRRPDMIRTVVLLFAIGLAVSGLTSLQTPEDKPRSLPAELSALGQWYESDHTEG